MSNLTCLFGDQFVPKTHPRIVFRGLIDRLEAECTLCAALCTDAFVCASLHDILGILADIMRAEVLEKPLPSCDRYLVGGRPLNELHTLSHDPPGGHRLIDESVGECCARLNLFRTEIRRAELGAIELLPERRDIHDTLNALSGAVYVLFCQMRESQSGGAI